MKYKNLSCSHHSVVLLTYSLEIIHCFTVIKHFWLALPPQSWGCTGPLGLLKGEGYMLWFSSHLVFSQRNYLLILQTHLHIYFFPYAVPLPQVIKCGLGQTEGYLRFAIYGLWFNIYHTCQGPNIWKKVKSKKEKKAIVILKCLQHGNDLKTICTAKHEAVKLIKLPITGHSEQYFFM